MKKIVGYFPSWGIYGGHRNYLPSKIPWDELTHVNFAFVQTMPGSFEIKSTDSYADQGATMGESWNSPFKGNFGQLQKLKGEHPHVSVMVSIGGWTLSGYFAEAGSSAEGRKTFAVNAVAYMKKYDFDGIDIDWEFPGKERQADKIDNANDQGTPDEGKYDSKKNFTLFLEALRVELDKQGEADGEYYQLTAAVGASRELIENTEPAKYSKSLDFINIMSYDLHGAWEDRTNHQAALFANPNLPDDKLTVSNAAYILADEYGIDRKKILLKIHCKDKVFSYTHLYML